MWGSLGSFLAGCGAVSLVALEVAPSALEQTHVASACRACLGEARWEEEHGGEISEDCSAGEVLGNSLERCLTARRPQRPTRRQRRAVAPRSGAAKSDPRNTRPWQHTVPRPGEWIAISQMRACRGGGASHPVEKNDRLRLIPGLCLAHSSSPPTTGAGLLVRFPNREITLWPRTGRVNNVRGQRARPNEDGSRRQGLPSVL
jgi:hypothetical protein